MAKCALGMIAVAGVSKGISARTVVSAIGTIDVPIVELGDMVVLIAGRDLASLVMVKLATMDKEVVETMVVREVAALITGIRSLYWNDECSLNFNLFTELLLN